MKTKITTEMKKLLLFTTLLAIMASCEIYIFDEQVEWDERDLFVGRYRIEEVSQTTEQHYIYNIDIKKSCCIDNKIKISNFYGAGINVYAYVNDIRITVPLQRRIENVRSVPSDRGGFMCRRIECSSVYSPSEGGRKLWAVREPLV